MSELAPAPVAEAGRLFSYSHESGRVSLGAKLLATGVAAFVSLPLFYLFIRAGERGAGVWLQHVRTARTAELLISTLSISAAVLALSIAIALPYAWLVTRTDLPGRRFWAVAGALPLVFPSYIAAFAIVSILGPHGLLASLLGRPFPEVAYGWSGALLALGLLSYPYLYLLLVAALRHLDPALEEAARSLGHSPAQVARRIVIPQLRVPLAAGSLVVVLYVLSDFGAVSIVRYDTFTTAIYDAYRGLFDRTIAAVLATVLVALTLVLLAAEWLIVRGVAPGRLRPSRASRRTPLGRWTPAALVFVGTVTLAAIGIPLAAIGTWSARALMAAERVPLEGSAIWNSFSVSFAAALVCVAASIPVAAWAVRGHGLPATIVERLTFSGYALPGIVIALSLVFAATRIARPFYQTATLLVLAYVIRFLPEAVAATRSAFSALSPRFEEAARSLGLGRLQVLRRVTVPMIRPGLLAGGGLVFLTSMKELPATLILRPTGFETLATRVWAEASLSSWSRAALPSLLILLVSALPVWALVIRPVFREER
ncbi:MAG TPA: iron ABC transporter permease [Thermoanaerobaculia bacterium]